MKTDIFLIRHGETDGTLERKYISSTDLPLNGKGRTQAQKLSERLCRENITAVYSSPKTRCLQFAELVFGKQKIEKKKELEELGFGVFEGLNHEELMNLYPEIYQKWIEDPFNNPVPGGEIFAEFIERVKRVIHKIIEENQGKRIAVVSHGGPVRVLLSEVRDLCLNAILQTHVDPASLCIIEYKNGKAEIIVQNDVSHLDG